MTDRCLHPGGRALTRRLLDLCPAAQQSRVLDIGCGDGNSAAYIHETYGYVVSGIEPDGAAFALAAARPGLTLHQAAVEALPYPDSSFDLVLCECVLSLADLDAALGEIHRVLACGGALLFSDLYARGTCAVTHGLVRHLHTEQQWQNSLDAAGFAVERLEEVSFELKAYLAQMVFEQGAEAAYCACGLDRELIQTARPGYLLAVARKNRPAPPIWRDHARPGRAPAAVRKG